MRRSSFFILGAPKCGTTSLASWLAEHPQIYMSPIKEPHFFNTDHDEPFRLTQAQYDGLFAGMRGERAAGEASVWYLASKIAVPNILRYNPDARFIVCLRNPVEMAPSLHKQRVFTGVEDLTSFEDAWRRQDRQHRGNPFGGHYGEACRLGEQLERLYRTVNRERVAVVFLDDMRADPVAAYQNILRFLQVDEDHSPDFRVHNPSTERKHLWLRKLLRRAGLMKRALGIRGGFGLITAVDQWNTKESKWAVSPAMTDELRAYFRNDIQTLARISGRDLSHWLVAPAQRKRA